MHLPMLANYNGDMKLSMIGLALLLATGVFAQSAAKPAFEVASIRPAAPMQPGQGGAGLRVDKAQVRISNLSLRDYVSMAYRVKLYQVTGPDWISSARFDIAATLAPDADTNKIPEMLQALLEERFQIKTHRDKKELPVYTVQVARDGLKIKESAADPSLRTEGPLEVTGAGSAAGISVNLGRGSSYTFADNKLDAKRVTVSTLALQLERFMDRPIVDKTGLTASYDILLEVTPEDYRTMLIRSAINAGVTLPPQALQLLDGASVPSLYDAFKKSGLTLDSAKEPLDLLVVDEMRKTPTEN